MAARVLARKPVFSAAVGAALAVGLTYGAASLLASPARAPVATRIRLVEHGARGPLIVVWENPKGTPIVVELLE